MVAIACCLLLKSEDPWLAKDDPSDPSDEEPPDLMWNAIESKITTLIDLCLSRWEARSATSASCSTWLWTLTYWIWLSSCLAAASEPKIPRAISSTRSGTKLPSVSTYRTSRSVQVGTPDWSRPDAMAAAESSMLIWVFPAPGGPQISVTWPALIPPPRDASSLGMPSGILSHGFCHFYSFFFWVPA